MADGRILRQLIKAGATGAVDDFRRVAEKVIQEERDKKHHLLASDLERILYGISVDSNRGDLALALPPVPVDRERKVPLLEIREPVRGLEDLVVAPSVREVLEETLAEQGRRDVLRSWGLRAVSRLLFVGPPGCGKTLASEVLATELGIPWIVVRFDAVVSSFLGETAANLRLVFDYLTTGRYLVLFDEFDAIAKEREDETEHGELRRVVSAFLQMMDGYRGESLMVAASNHEGMLDRALWRRFDEVLRFDRPNEDQIVTLLEVKLRGVRRDFDLTKRSIPTSFTGLAHADIERVIIRAVKSMVLAGREFLSMPMLEHALEREAERRELCGAGSA